MNIRYICIISILVAATVVAGCVDKSSPGTLPVKTTDKGISPGVTEKGKVAETVKANDSSSKLEDSSSSKDNNVESDIGSDNSSDSSSDNMSEESSGNLSDYAPDDSSIDNGTEEPDVVPDNTSSPDLTEDTSVTQVFKIGEEKKMLGRNIKLVNITNYDNGEITLLVDGVEYKYKPDSGLKAGGIEIVDVITVEDDKTAEIIVNYAAK